MTSSVGTIVGAIRISAKQALATYASVQRANATTKAALLSASATFTKVGVAALAAAAPIALMFKSAITNAAQFQKRMDYYGAVTNASKKEMQDLAQVAIQMSKTTVFSAMDMADAFVEFGKAGISAKDIMGGVARATANLAQAADISMGDAANIMASQMATFNISAKDSAHIANQIAGAANASIIDVQDLAYSLKYAGGIAAATGVSFDSLVTAVSMLGQRGIRGSTAGTSLRQIMVSLTGATSAATKEMTDLGIITKNGTNRFIDQKGHIKDLNQVFQILQNHEKGLTDAQQLSANKTIFNSRALAAVMILMRDGAKGFANMSRQIDKVTASDVAHKRLNNLAGDATKLKNSWQTLMIQVGGPLQNMLRGVVKALTAVVHWFSNLSPATQKTIIYVLGAVAAFLILTGILALTIGLVLKVITVWKDLWLALKLLGGWIKSVIVGIRALGVAMMANPWTIWLVAIAAVVAIVIYCWNHFKGFRDFVKAMGHLIVEVAKAIWHGMVAAFHAVVNAAKALAKGFMDYVVHPIEKAWDAVVGAFKAAYHWISGVISNIISFVHEHWKAIIAILLGPLGLIIDAIVTHWDWIKKVTIGAVHAIGSFLSGAWNAIKSAAIAVWNAISTAISAVWNAIKFIVLGAVHIITGVVRGAWNTIRTISTGIWNGIKAFFTAIWHTLVRIFGGPVNAIKKVISGAWNWIKGITSRVWGGISGFFSSIWNRIVGIFSSAWNTISGGVSRLWHTIAGAVGRAMSAVWHAIAGAAGKVAGAVGQMLKGAWDKLMGFVGDMLGVGKRIVEGIWNGITSLAGWLWDQVSGWISSLWHSILDFFGIKSPSKKGKFAGRMIMLGIVAGLNEGTPQAVNAAVRASRAISDALTHEHSKIYKYMNSSMIAVADRVAKNMDTIRSKLKDAIKKYNDEVRGVQSTFMQGADITSMGHGTNAKGQQTKVTIGNLETQYGQAANRAIVFARRIRKLFREGVNKNLVRELAEAGPEAAGAQVRALAQATPRQIAYINKARRALSQAGAYTGGILAKKFYKAGIQAAQGLVNGMKRQERQLMRIAAAMGETILKHVKKALHIHSPSGRMEKEVGLRVVEGLARGITRNKHLAIKAVEDLGDALVNAHMGTLAMKFDPTMRNLHSGMKAQGRWAHRVSNHTTNIGVNVEKLEVNNPVRERASVSIPQAIRKANYMASGPAR